MYLQDIQLNIDKLGFLAHKQMTYRQLKLSSGRVRTLAGLF